MQQSFTPAFSKCKDCVRLWDLEWCCCFSQVYGRPWDVRYICFWSHLNIYESQLLRKQPWSSDPRRKTFKRWLSTKKQTKRFYYFKSMVAWWQLPENEPHVCLARNFRKIPPAWKPRDVSDSGGWFWRADESWARKEQLLLQGPWPQTQGEARLWQTRCCL